MKFSIFAFLGMIRSDPNHNLLLPYMLAGSNDGVNSNTALAMMLAQNAHHGGSGKISKYGKFVQSEKDY